VHVEFVQKFPRIIDLKTLKGYAEKGGPLEKMQLVTSGRLSVTKVSKEEWEFILGLAAEQDEEGEAKSEVADKKAKKGAKKGEKK
jgi:predicted RNA-binding protein with PUA-like domain